MFITIPNAEGRHATLTSSVILVNQALGRGSHKQRVEGLKAVNSGDDEKGYCRLFHFYFIQMKWSC